jgi:hypothetical protein
MSAKRWARGLAGEGTEACAAEEAVAAGRFLSVAQWLLMCLGAVNEWRGDDTAVADGINVVGQEN